MRRLHQTSRLLQTSRRSHRQLHHPIFRANSSKLISKRKQTRLQGVWCGFDELILHCNHWVGTRILPELSWSGLLVSRAGVQLDTRHGGSWGQWFEQDATRLALCGAASLPRACGARHWSKPFDEYLITHNQDFYKGGEGNWWRIDGFPWIGGWNWLKDRFVLDG